MIAVYSSPSHGYMSLAPVTDLGCDEVVALWKAGVRKGESIRAASGWAMLILGDGPPRAVRLTCSNVQSARCEAIRATPLGDVVILKAWKQGRFTVFVRVETLKALTVGEAAKDDSVSLVGPQGILVEKSLSPADPVDGRIISERLAGQLRFDERVLLKAKLEEYVANLKVDWTSLSDSAMAKEISNVRTALRSMMGSSANLLMPTWKSRIDVTLKNVFKATRQVLKSNFIPTVGISLQQADLRAVSAIGAQQGWWMRDAAGVRSDQLTARARGIVQDGLKKGLGKVEIARSLRTALPEAWQKFGANYFKAVSSVAVSRGRSYSEVSGYVEVGIESLEVQAVLDERTTEICRCLDGQIIDTHVVSQQIVGAMNVASPEDIKDASPFLRESFNKETGLKEIVTANNGTKIAEVLRSGVGRADDRGQFNMLRQGNGLADANIGPPPYHHLCRSWTIPVTSTISVPRNYSPRAIDTPTPVPPRAVPAGKKPPPGVGQRPQVPMRTPSPTRPTPVGDPDVVDRYPFTDDFVNPVALPRAAIDPATGDLVSGAVGQRYSFDAEARVIRAAGKEFTVPRPTTAGKHPLAELARSLELSSQTSGLLLHVSKVDVGAVRQIVLAEVKQPAAMRVYSVRAADTGGTTLLRFNHNVKGGAKDAIRALRQAKDEQSMMKAIAEMEKKGFIEPSGSGKDVLFGKPAPTMPPGKAPKPKPAPKPPKPKPRPKPPTEPVVRPKPRATSTAVSPTGRIEPKPKPAPKPAPKQPPAPQMPKPGPAKDYSEYGLLKKIPVDQQAKERIKRETARLRDYLKHQETVFQRRLGRAMNSHERSDKIREFIAADTGEAAKITLEQVKKRTKRAIGHTKIELRQTVERQIERGFMGIGPDKVLSQVRMVPMSPEKKAELFNDAFKHLSQRVLDATLKKKLPDVLYAEGVNGGAFFDSMRNVIVLPDWRYRSMDAFHQTFRHEFGHYVENLGKGIDASTFFRDAYKTGNVVKGPQYPYLPGKWADRYTGSVLQLSGTEVTSTTSEVFAKNSTKDIGLTYDTNPDQIGFYMAQAKGAFIP